MVLELIDLGYTSGGAVLGQKLKRDDSGKHICPVFNGFGLKDLKLNILFCVINNIPWG